MAWLDQYYSSDSTLYTMKDFFGGEVNVPTSIWSPKDSMVDIDTVAGTLAQLPNAKWRPIEYGPEATNTGTSAPRPHTACCISAMTRWPTRWTATSACASSRPASIPPAAA
ncbi:hypothetical protein H1235_06030 [Pseudoxanthomonas sp. NC8]|nr:hypothetical protein H1235_06030 [Pseudoxanthomonas sp. NC8]